MSIRRMIVVVAALAVAGASCSSAGSGSDGSPPPSGSPPASSPGGSVSPSAPLSPGTSSPSSPAAQPGPVTPSSGEEIVTGLAAPWSIAFVPGSDGQALVTQRDEGTIVLVDASGTVTPVGAVPGVDGTGEGGLLGIAFDPASPGDLYVYATMGAQNVVQRTTYANGALGAFSLVLDGIPAGTRHDGGRLAFGPDGMLYISTGESGNPDDAQDLGSLGGKILRISPSGSVPADNPFDGSPIWSYGHRNVEGLAFDDEGRLWASEFGDREADEVNLIVAGGNYGWPFVEGIGGAPDYVDPVVEWRPTSESSPSGLAYVRDTLFVAALRGERLWQVPLTSGGEAGEPAAFVTEFGRLRDAVVAPDGTLWVLTNNTDGRGSPREGDDRILRLTLTP